MALWRTACCFGQRPPARLPRRPPRGPCPLVELPLKRTSTILVPGVRRAALIFPIRHATNDENQQSPARHHVDGTKVGRVQTRDTGSGGGNVFRSVFWTTARARPRTKYSINSTQALQSELIGASTTADKAVWFFYSMESHPFLFGVKSAPSVPLLIDNQACLSVTNHPYNSTKSRHITSSLRDFMEKNLSKEFVRYKCLQIWNELRRAYSW